MRLERQKAEDLKVKINAIKKEAKRKEKEANQKPSIQARTKQIPRAAKNATLITKLTPPESVNQILIPNKQISPYKDSQ